LPPASAAIRALDIVADVAAEAVTREQVDLVVRQSVEEDRARPPARFKPARMGCDELGSRDAAEQ